MHLAREIMAQTRIYQRLRYSLLRRANINALALTLVKISQMVIDLAELTELHINPLRVNARGVVALDARMQLTSTARVPAQRLAIRPYPKTWKNRSPCLTGGNCCCARCCPKMSRRCRRWCRAPRPRIYGCAFSSRSGNCRIIWRRR